MKKTLGFLTLLVGLSVFAPAMSFAQSATSTSAIEQLKQRILELQAQILELRKQQEQATLELLKTLALGASGQDVRTLQAFLAADPSIYPEGKITGFFGPLTAKAVKKFQEKNGIEAVGFVGPKTLKKLNEKLKESSVVVIGDTQTVTASSTCTILPPGHYIAPGWNKKMNDDDDDDEDDDEDEDEDDDSGKKNKGKKDSKWGNVPFTIPCGQLPPGIAKKLNLGTTTPPASDTTAPVISSTSVSDIGTTSARINWATNEATRAQIAYGTSTAYAIETGWSSSAATTGSHLITGLTANTTYHFRIRVKDLAGNVTTSGDMTFTTAAVLPPADTTAPVISGISAGSIASTAATVSWTTNENADSKVYYGTTTPLVLGSALWVHNAASVTSHSMSLSGLTASTTHYYVVESKDGAGNTATSTENSFTTAP